jgi:hypothetical protein
MNVDKLGNEDVPKLGYDERKQNLIDIMNEDAKDGLYDVREDDVEKLAEEHLTHWRALNNIHLSNVIHAERCKNDFKAGYNKAKENTYTEEQVRQAIGIAKDFRYDMDTNEIIQSIKQPK